MRIAVFLSGFPFQGYLRDLLATWTEEGHEVDLYRSVQRVNRDTVDQGAWCARIVDVEARDSLYRWTEMLERRLYPLHLGLARFSLSLLYSRFAHSLRHENYDLFIGVEKIGLIIASRLGKAFDVPYVYYSLELYVEDHPDQRRFAYLREPERLANAGAVATIIQDQRRASVLAKANRLTAPRFVFLPVGAAPSSAGADDRAGRPEPGRFTILFIGLLNQRRRVPELIGVAKRLADNEFLHLHGPDFQADPLDTAGDKVIVSRGLLSEAALDILVQNADIGVALYANEPLNDRLTAFSSHKIALYLRHGKPIIVSRNESYEDLMAAYPCGEMIKDISELPNAVARIRAEYAHYSNAALRAFAHFYNLGGKGPWLIGSLERLIGNTHAVAQPHGTSVDTSIPGQ